MGSDVFAEDGPEALPDPVQHRIWDHYQNDARESFAASTSRLRHLAGMVPRGGRVLDVGVGSGVFEEVATAMGLQVYALDPSERSIASLRERLAMGERAQVGYSQSMPFPDGHFDAVVMSEVMEHLPDDVLAKTVEEIHRVLVPGGVLLGTVPARDEIERHTVFCLHCGERFHRWGHVRAFDEASMRALLSRTLRVEEIYERPFTTWGALNWKGKATAAVKMAMWKAGVHGGDEHIVFRARKVGDGGPSRPSDAVG